MLPHTGLFLLWKVALQMRIRPVFLTQPTLLFLEYYTFETSLKIIRSLQQVIG